MKQNITIQEVTGGFILSYSNNDAYEQEVVVNESKLIKRLRELLASTSVEPEQLNG